MPESDQERLFGKPTRIKFWVRRFISSDQPVTVMRELFDDDGLIGRERYDRQTGTWVDHHSIEHTGIGGSVDWDTATPEEAAEVLWGWGNRGNPADV